MFRERTCDIVQTSVLRKRKANTPLGLVLAGLSFFATQTDVLHAQIPQQEELPKGRIAYLKQKQAVSQIYISDLDGKNARKLTKSSTRESDPKWLDEERVVFTKPENPPYKSGIAIYSTQTEQESFLLAQELKVDQSDFCPAPDRESGIIFSRLSIKQPVSQVEDLYRYGTHPRDEKLELLTPDNKKAYVCPVVSTDGKLVAFSARSGGLYGQPEELTILARDKVQEQVLSGVKIKGTEALAWSPDNKNLLFLRQIVVGRQLKTDLYVVGTDGQNELRIAENVVRGGTWSPDGKWVVYPAKNGEEDSDLYIVPSRGGQPRKLFDTPEDEVYPQWQPERLILPKDVGIVFGLITEIKDGYETHNLTRNFEERLLEPGMDYTRSAILRFSLGGWIIDGERGFYLPKDQKCTDTLESIDSLGNKFLSFLRDSKTLKPRRELVVVTQSMGGPIVLNGLQKIKDGSQNLDIRRMRFIFAHGPNMGVTKPGLAFLGQIWSREMPEQCKILFGATPPPSVLAFQSGQDLLRMWDNREERKRELAELTAWLGRNESSIVTLNNYEDCVIFTRGCLFPRELLEIEMLKERFLGALLEQEIPGAINIWRFLGKEDFGHRRYWDSPEGLSILTTLIGSQRK